MQEQSYFQLISPMIFLVFSCGFAVLWHFARDVRALKVFAVSYLLGAVGLLFDFIRPLLATDVAIFVINPVYMATAATFSAAMFVFYRARVPVRALVGVSVCTLALLTWFRFGHDMITARTLLMNAGGFVMFAYPAIALRRQMRRKVDRVLQALVFLNGLQLLVRTLVVIWFEGGTLTQANYPQSAAALTFQLSVSFAALAIAVNLFVMFGMEIVAGLTETSETDPMTGVLNRRGLESRVAGFAAGQDRMVIMADIDRFKSINDRYGHEAGDRVITNFARILDCSAREGDLVVRWGGEEFMVVFAAADPALARLYAESARCALEALNQDCVDGATVTASFGIACWPAGAPFPEAVHMADKALYRAKRNGRNRVTVHERNTRITKGTIAAA